MNEFKVHETIVCDWKNVLGWVLNASSSKKLIVKILGSYGRNKFRYKSYF